VADAVEKDQCCTRYGPGQIFGMLAFDEFVPLALYDPNWHPDLLKLLPGVIRLRALHQADIFDELFELLWRSGELLVILSVARETTVQCWTKVKRSYTRRIHIAGKEEDARPK